MPEGLSAMSQGNLSEGGQEEDWLCLAIREELCDWPASSLRGIEDKLVALDSSLRGTLKQSQIIDVFLNKEVPLKLPSFHLLLKAFSDVHNPDKVESTKERDESSLKGYFKSLHNQSWCLS